MAIDDYLASKEDSDGAASQYKMRKQHILTDRKASEVGLMDSREFIKKLRDSGIKCITYQQPWTAETPAWLKNTVGLHVHIPSQPSVGHLYGAFRYKYICYMDIPCMYEWSVLLTDEHELPSGESRGWRTVLSEMVKKGAITEAKVNEIFGAPTGDRSEIYQETMSLIRDGRFKENDGQSIA